MISLLAGRIFHDGLDDWVSLRNIVVIAQNTVGGEKGDVDTAVLAAIRELVAAGLVEVGEVSDGGFFEWDGSLQESIERIARSLRLAQDENDYAFAVWLCNTTQGDEIARRPSTGC
jgi:hypothetical protein